MLMTQQRFQVTANGFVELNGSITVEVDRDTTIAVALCSTKLSSVQW